VKTIPCIFCNKINTNVVIRENGFIGVKCTCNLIYISPRPSEKDIINLYGHDDAHLTANDHINQAFSKRLHANHSLGIIKKYIPQGDLLEIGAGAGYFLNQAKKRKYSPYGIELNPAQAQFIRDLGIPCQETPLAINSFENRRFDIIYHADVVSHFYDPIKAFTIMHQKLKKNGYLVFETGNLGDVQENYYSLIPSFQYPDHLFFFSEKNIHSLLELTGFKLIKIYRYSIVPQLLFHKGIHRFFHKDIKKKSLLSSNGAFKTYQKSPLSAFFKNNYYFLMHVLRYKIGNFSPKSKKPQTIIVVAQKK